MRTHIFAIVMVLAIGLVAPVTAAQASADSSQSVVQKALINLNTATLAELETLPGVGRATAERIVEHRQKSGGFKKIEELMNVKGIGEKSFLKLKPLVVVTPKPDKAGGAH